MDAILHDVLAQLGAIGLLVAFMYWTIRGKNTELKAERDRNAALTDRLFTLASTVERTMGELTAAVKGSSK